MSDNANSENIKDPHTALASLWPSDGEESKKLAEQKQQKRQYLTDLGGQFKQAREALGYNISDLDEHTGLSFTELEALEAGLFQQIEQQDYVDYYVHTYAALLGLDADEMLQNFQQNYHQSAADIPPTNIDIHDETQYEEAFADEAKQTLEALEASGINVLQATAQSIDPADNAPNADATLGAAAADADPSFATGQAEPALENPQYVDDGSETNFGDLQANTDQQPITSGASSFPWFKLSLSFAFVLLAAFVIYLLNNQYNLTQNSADNVNTAEQITNLSNVSTNKGADRVPEEQKAKKIATLDSKIVAQGSDNLNAPTADAVQKPLVLQNSQAVALPDENANGDAGNADASNGDASNASSTNSETATPTETIPDVIGDAVKAAETAGETVVKEAVEISDDLAAAAELAAAAAAEKAALLAAEEAAVKEAAAKALPEDTSAQLPEDPIQEALAALPSDTNKYSLHATQNNWVLIEDDAAQILFSGELTPEKIITLPKIQGVIISLGDAGIIEVYKGKQLLGLLGEKDESLDLVSVEQRFNQITN